MGHIANIDIPRNISRRNGDGKRKADMEDLLDLWERLDVAKACLPLFCAANLNRLPPLSFTDTNVSSLAVMVLDMRGQLTDMQSKLSQLSTNINAAQQSSYPTRETVKGASTSGTTSGTGNNMGPVTSGSDTRPALTNDVPGCNQASWADRCRRDSDSDGFILVGGRKKQSPKKSIICGKKVLPVDSTIKAAPRRLTVFVGRLDRDVTDVALSDYLHAAGIEGAVCKKLTAKSGVVFRTSAFMVSCEAKFSNILYDESMWPSGVELRDWVFYKKEAVSG